MLIGKIIPGYNTLMVAIIMATFMLFVLTLSVWRAVSGSNLDIITSAVAFVSLCVIGSL